jgi:hypothetical protein
MRIIPTICPRCMVEWLSTCRRICQRGKLRSIPPGSWSISSFSRLVSVSASSQGSKPVHMTGQVRDNSSNDGSGGAPCGSRQVPPSGVVRKQSSQTRSPSQICLRVERRFVCEMRKSRSSSSGARAEQASSEFRLAHADWRTSTSSTCLARDTREVYIALCVSRFSARHRVSAVIENRQR